MLPLHPYDAAGIWYEWLASPWCSCHFLAFALSMLLPPPVYPIPFWWMISAELDVIWDYHMHSGVDQTLPTYRIYDLCLWHQKAIVCSIIIHSAGYGWTIHMSHAMCHCRQMWASQWKNFHPAEGQLWSFHLLPTCTQILTSYGTQHHGTRGQRMVKVQDGIGTLCINLYEPDTDPVLWEV